MTKEILRLFLVLLTGVFLFLMACGSVIGLNAKTSFEVFMPMLVISTFIYTLQTVNVYISRELIPLVVLLFLYVGRPAYKQWGTVPQSVSPFGLIPETATWYANGWFQIAVALVLVGCWYVLAYEIPRNED